MLGAICLSHSSHFPPIIYSKLVKPVALPPGRARLCTQPAPTGSGTFTITIGMVRLACSTNAGATPPTATSTSGASATNSAAFRRMASASPPDRRYSIDRFPPDVQPSCLRLCSKTGLRASASASPAEKGSSTPMRRMRSPCCACAASGHAAAAPPSSVMNSRRPIIRSPRRRGNRRSRRLDSRYRNAVRIDHGHLAADELCRQRWNPIILIVGKVIFNGDVLALDESGLLKAVPECTDKLSRAGRRRAAEEPNHRHCRLLRPHRHGPCRRAAEQPDDLAPPHHSITSSARSSSAGGTSRRRALAVLRLITSSNLVGYCTGRSGGFAPRSIRSTYVTPSRTWSVRLFPYEINPPARAKNAKG